MAKTPPATKPDPKPFPGKRSRDANEDDDNESVSSKSSTATTARPEEPPPPRGPNSFQLPEAERQDLDSILKTLEPNHSQAGILMQVMRNAFQLPNDDATLLYLNTVLRHTAAEDGAVDDNHNNDGGNAAAEDGEVNDSDNSDDGDGVH